MPGVFRLLDPWYPSKLNDCREAPKAGPVGVGVHFQVGATGDGKGERE
jgi:hypothetical protein